MNETSITFPPLAQNRHVWLVIAPVICTAHFPQADLDCLYHHEVCFMHDNEGHTVLLCIEDPEEYGLTAAGTAVLTHFLDLGYSYLRLDPDGHLVTGLPTVFLENDPGTLPVATALPAL